MWVHVILELCNSLLRSSKMKLKSVVKAFTIGNYFCQPVVVYLFAKSLNLSFTLEFQSDVI